MTRTPYASSRARPGLPVNSAALGFVLAASLALARAAEDAPARLHRHLDPASRQSSHRATSHPGGPGSGRALPRAATFPLNSRDCAWLSPPQSPANFVDPIRPAADNWNLRSRAAINEEFLTC